MKGKVNGTTSRPSKSAAPDDRGTEYKDMKPSKSVDLTNKKSKDEEVSYSPTDVLLIPGEKVLQIACGVIHSMALTNSNRVFSCGSGSSFNLGHGNRDTLTQFKPIEYFTENNLKVAKIACGMNHSGCITDKGKVYLWGITSDISYSLEMKEKCLLKKPTLISFINESDEIIRGKDREPTITDLKLGE
jgi:alpha-tubulin suppressor-like RCC1 family protein